MIDALKIQHIIADCAEKHLVPYFKKLTADQIHEKTSPQDVATQADIETEENLIKRIKAAYPDCECIGEESFDPNKQDILQHPSLFVIDPLDGTNAFRNERPGFAIMVTYMQKGVPTQIWVHAPLLQETLYAAKGQGVTLNGKPVISPPLAAPKTGTGHLSATHRQEMQDMAKRLEGVGLVLAPHAHACTDFLRFAKGELDFIVYQNSYPWDILPGVLVAHELGGYTATLRDGRDMMVDPFADIQAPVLYARHKDHWDDLKRAFSSAA